MSAITGIFYRDGRKVDPELIKKMNDKLSHRGPDGSAVWCEDSVALGHQMLWTTPESLHEKLPFHDEKAGLVITADARIDNRKDLSEELDIEDKENVSDSYFILKAYEKWGEKCLEYLLGDFAFAIWDKNEEKLFCARDHMGVKPFYYYLDDDMFVFGTEIKSLFCIPEVPKEINELQVVNFLAFIFKERQLTFYKDILRLPAAHYLNLTSRRNQLERYWKLDINKKIRLDNDKEYINAFNSIFTETVKCRLRSAFPVGSMLSGGLDSSFVTCTAQNILKDENRGDIKTFSAYFDGAPKSNERYFIEKVLSCHDFESYYIEADKIGPLDEIDEFFLYADQPVFPPNNFMGWNIYREANKNGVRVLLDGLEGDVTVSHGTGYLSELARKRKLKKFLFEVKCTSKRLGISQNEILLSIGFGVLVPNSIKRIVRHWRDSNSSNSPILKLIDKDLAESAQLIDKLKISGSDEVFDAHKRHYYSLRSCFFQHELEVVDSRASPFSIEIRHPFFDKRLIEFCLAIPTDQKYSNGWDRYIMRKAMSNIVPREIQWRKDKGNLSYNFNNSLVKYNKTILENTLFKNDILLKRYINKKEIQKIYNNYISGDNSQNIYLWNIVLLIIWLRKIEKI